MAARALVAERDALRGERDALERERDALRAENASLRRTQLALSHPQELRLVAGLAVAWLATCSLAASWWIPGGSPPVLGNDAGPLAGLGALVGATVIGLWGPCRPAALATLGGAGVLLAGKPGLAPVISDWGPPHPFGLTSETHLYYLVPGVLALALTVIFAVLGRRRQDAGATAS
jgi:hypothetical protein